MPSLSLGLTDLANNALMAIGQRKIASLTDQTDPNAVACNVAWPQAFGSVARETPWNCLKAPQTLAQLVTPYTTYTYNSDIPASATTWVPGTNYAVNAYVIYAGYLYQCLIANTSSGSFTVDLTRGYWFQTNTFNPNFFGVPVGNSAPGTGWLYAYELPADFIALCKLNGWGTWSGWGWGAFGGSFGGGWGGFGGGTGGPSGQAHEIIGAALYTNASAANIVYVQYTLNTAQYDPLFSECLELKLASMVATDLRKDNASIAEKMTVAYLKRIQIARTKNAGDDRLRRFNPISSSRFVRARRFSTNG